MTAKVSENTERACGHVSSCPLRPTSHLVLPQAEIGAGSSRLEESWPPSSTVLWRWLWVFLICENYEGGKGGKHRKRACCVIPNANQNSKRQNICSKITQENVYHIVNSTTKLIPLRQPCQGMLQCSPALTSCASCATSQSLWCLPQRWDWVPHSFPLLFLAKCQCFDKWHFLRQPPCYPFSTYSPLAW